MPHFFCVEPNPAAELNVPPPAPELAERVSRLGKFVDQLQSEGCRCVVLEMPIDASLCDLASPKAIRQAVHERFPNGKYRWLTFAKGDAYQTRDGIHLTREEADRLTDYVLQQIPTIAHTQP